MKKIFSLVVICAVCLVQAAWIGVPHDYGVTVETEDGWKYKGYWLTPLEGPFEYWAEDQNTIAFPIENVTAGDVLVPVIGYADMPRSAFKKVEVVSDEKLFSAIQEPMWPYMEQWEWYDWDNTFDLHVENERDKTVVHACWNAALWPENCPVSTRKWILVSLGKLTSPAGIPVFRVGLKASGGNEQWSDPVCLEWYEFPEKTMALDRRVSVDGQALIYFYPALSELMDAPCSSTSYKLYPEGGRPQKLTFKIPSAGRLVFAGGSENGFFSGTGISSGTGSSSGGSCGESSSLGGARSFSFEDSVEGFYRYGKEWGTVWVVDVDKATTLTYTESGDGSTKVSRVHFFPAGKKSVAIDVLSFSRVPEEIGGVRLSDENYGWAFLQGTVKGAGVYTAGEKVTLQAVPYAGEAFDHWEVRWGDELPEGLDLESPTLSFVVPEEWCGDMEEERQIVLQAVWKERTGFAWEKAELSGTRLVDYVQQSQISILIDGYEADACKVAGAGFYAYGKTATLKATPAKGSAFCGWFDLETGMCLSTATSWSVKVSEDSLAVVARFIPARYDYLRVLETGDQYWDVGQAVEPSAEAYYELETESAATISVSGLPAGVKFDAKTQTFSGAPTKAGVYYVAYAAKNANGYTSTAFVRWYVGQAEEARYDEIGTHLADLNDWGTGDYAFVELGVFAKLDVKGLPAGIKLVKDDTLGGSWVLKGVPTKAGFYTLTATQTEGRTSKKAVCTILIRDNGCYYLDVQSEDASRGSVTGAGVYPHGATVKLTAKANKGYYFATWTGDIGEADAQALDWRAASLPVLNWGGTIVGRFVTAAEDRNIYIDCDGGCWDVDMGVKSQTFAFNVESATLPKVTAKGLPTGVKLTGMNFEIADVSKLKPGRSQVTLEASNLSGAKTTATFMIAVPNLRSGYIRVEDSFGAFDPGVAIEPIDLADFIGESELASADVKGLPKGLTFNKKDDAKKGIRAMTITGMPTVPGVYTVYFTVKVGKTTETATATMTVNPFPKLDVDIDQTSADAGCKVTGSGAFMVNTKVTLKATPAKGYAFAGWYFDPDYECPAEGLVDYRTPSFTYLKQNAEEKLYARFIPISEDRLDIYGYQEVDAVYAFEPGAECDFSVQEEFYIYSPSLPTITVAGLPTGLKYDTKTGRITGRVSKAKTGWGVFTVAAKNASGYQATTTYKYSIDGAANPVDAYVNDWMEGNECPIFLGDNGAEVGVDCRMVRMLSDIWVSSLVNVFPLESFTSVETVEDEMGRPKKLTSTVTTKLTCTGLPAGLKLVSFPKKYEEAGELWSYKGTTTSYYIQGAPTKAGRYTVLLTYSYDSNEGGERYSRKETYAFDVYVDLAPSRWVNVTVMPDESGAVHGKVGTAGVYAAGTALKLTATPDRDYVFAGWYSDNGEEDNVYAENVLKQAGDYTVAAQSRFVGYGRGYFHDDAGQYYSTEFEVPNEFRARFIPKSEDRYVDIRVNFPSGEEDEQVDAPAFDLGMWDLDRGVVASVFAYSIMVSGEVGSRAAVTAVTGLPKGMTAVKRGDGIAELRVTGTVPPGRYTVTLTAKNQSGVTTTSTLGILSHCAPNEFFQNLGLDQSDKGYGGENWGFGVGVDAQNALYGLADLAQYAEDMGLTLTFSGLPSGLSVKKVVSSETGDRVWQVVGMPTKAGVSTVTVTAKGTWDGMKINETAQFFVDVLPLPDWAVGTFNGRSEANGDGWRDREIVTLTVGDKGKISAKFNGAEGSSFTLSPTFTYISSDCCEMSCAWLTKEGERGEFRAEINRESFLDVRVGRIDFSMRDIDDDGDYFEEVGCAHQQLWGNKDIALPQMSIKPQILLEDGILVLKPGSKGAVTSVYAPYGAATETVSAQLSLLNYYFGDDDELLLEFELPILLPKSDRFVIVRFTFNYDENYWSWYVESDGPLVEDWD
ncbi:MAG: putative Ig domain-containing protein [Kiritimatiellae bacterium]|nr:putative Ig domain-containing protein [Kiritimatiellia bacterium]